MSDDALDAEKENIDHFVADDLIESGSPVKENADESTIPHTPHSSLRRARRHTLQILPQASLLGCQPLTIERRSRFSPDAAKLWTTSARSVASIAANR